MAQIRVRPAVGDDLPRIAAIYAHHVLNGFGSFEEDAPDTEEMARRLAAIVDAGLPWLVAEIDGSVGGYAYAGPYRTRSAYRHTLEDSVYVDPDRTGQGIGRLLLGALIARCEAGPWRQLVAVIGNSGNAGSIRLHASLGFRLVGTLEAVGFKRGRWVDSVLMQRPLGHGSRTLPP
jgi:phosphinothricin acetyltransferase